MTETQTRRIDVAGGRAVDFDIGLFDQDDAYFVLGIRKCGSSIMHSMVHDLARLNGHPFVDVGGRFFAANVPEQAWRSDPRVLDALAPGNVYGGFRAMPLVFTQSGLFRRSRKILLVRDPRDALVSEYFSISFSHGLPAAAAADGPGGAREEFVALRRSALASGIEQVVLERAPLLNRTFLEYADAAADPLTAIFRYEDVILEKRPWLAAMAAHFGWHTGSPRFVEGMMGWADKIPGEENAQAFIRKVVPGDHRDKLSPAVIARLNEMLAPAMALFGYRPG
jgi:hypothetical protein